MIKALGEAVYWVAYLGTAFFAAMGTWALMNFHIADPRSFVIGLVARIGTAFLIGYVVREMGRRFG